MAGTELHPEPWLADPMQLVEAALHADNIKVMLPAMMVVLLEHTDLARHLAASLNNQSQQQPATWSTGCILPAALTCIDVLVSI